MQTAIVAEWAVTGMTRNLARDMVYRRALIHDEMIMRMLSK